MKCPKCGSYDVDVAPANSGKDLECQECGRRWTIRTRKKKPSVTTR
jgi:hypothetical protein